MSANLPVTSTTEFNFPGYVLWNVFFTVDRQVKTFTCKLCNKTYQYTRSLDASHANTHLNAKKHNKDRDTILRMSQDSTNGAWTEDRNNEFSEALTDFAALPSVSLNCLQSESFRRLLKTINPNCPTPSAGTIRKRLLDKSDAIYETMENNLCDFKGYLSATIDIWTDHAMLRSYIGITLHFIRGKELVYYCLGVEELIGKHTGVNIKEHVINKLKAVGIELKDIFAIVTDNGANIMAAFRPTKVESSDSEDDEDNIDDGVSEEDLDKMSEVDDDDIMTPLDEISGNRYSCSAHNLQLCLFHAIKETLAKDKAFKKLLKLQRSFAHSSQARSALKNEAGKLYKTMINTRWATWIDVLARHSEIKGPMAKIATDFRFSHLDSADNDLLEQYLNVLQVFKDAIVLLEYRDQPTISWLFVIIKTLLHFLNGLEIEDSAIKQMCDILKAQIHKRFDNVMDEELFIVATYLDPATIDRLTSDETNKAREILTEWIGKIEYDREVENVTKKPKLSGEANLFSQLMGSRSQIKPNPGKNEDISAINAYVAEAASMFSQLDEVSFSSRSLDVINVVCSRNSRFSKIHQVARKLLSIPSTTSPIEGVFSVAGLLTHGHKSNTKSKLLNAKVVVHSNRDLK